jgi:hypothetical protein
MKREGVVMPRALATRRPAMQELRLLARKQYMAKTLSREIEQSLGRYYSGK